MSHRRRRAAGTLLGAGAVAVALWLVGPRAVGAALASAAPLPLAAAAGCVALALLAWATALWLALRSLGAGVGVPRALVLYLGTLFLNAVTPLGQAGGDPPSGLLLARGTDTAFESGLAAITGVNTVNRVAGLLVGAVAALAVGTGGTGAALLAPAAVALVAALAAAWRWRDRLVPPVAGLFTPPTRAVAALLPGVERPSRAGVRGRVEGFVAAVERIATPRTLVVVFALGALGQLAVAGTLWLSLLAVGMRTPLATAVVAVPLSRLGAVVPTPGGVGGVDLALGALVVVLAGAATPLAAAAVLVYRAVSYLAPMVPGGVVAGSVLAGGR